MKHITHSQRYSIMSLLKQDISFGEIASSLGKAETTIRREVERNKDQRSGNYDADLAIRKCKERHKHKRKKIRFTDEVKQNVVALLKEDYSPEQIVGTLKKENKKTVSHERIYQFTHTDKKQGGTLYKHLRRRGRKYQKRNNINTSRGLIAKRVSIDHRPKEVEHRARFGDLEVDLIIGKNHQEAIVTINDRASGMLKMRKVKSKEAAVVQQAITEELADWMPYIYTMTSDNGKEFAEHEIIAEKLYIDYYFAHPYHSWERGSNENLNGLIRQYIPKSSDFSKITKAYINQIENKLNSRPRKRFNYETPNFVMNKLLFHQKLHL